MSFQPIPTNSSVFGKGVPQSPIDNEVSSNIKNGDGNTQTSLAGLPNNNDHGVEPITICPPSMPRMLANQELPDISIEKTDRSDGTITPSTVGEKLYLDEGCFINTPSDREQEINNLNSKIKNLSWPITNDSNIQHLLKFGRDLQTLLLIPKETTAIIFEQNFQHNIRNTPVGPLVKRFGVEAEKLTTLIGQDVPIDTLHSIERIILSHALDELKEKTSAMKEIASDTFANNAVVVDIFARPKAKIQEYIKTTWKNDTEVKTSMGFPEIHSIVLWKKKDDEIVIIDPSNSDFSAHIKGLLTKEQLTNNIVTIFSHPASKTIYSSGPSSNSRPQNMPEGWVLSNRDCTDIAIKIGFSLNQAQSRGITAELIELSVFWQLSNLISISQTLPRDMDRSLIKGLQSSDFSIQQDTVISSMIIKILLTNQKNSFIGKINSLLNNTKNPVDAKALPWLSHAKLEDAAKALLINQFIELYDYGINRKIEGQGTNLSKTITGLLNEFDTSKSSLLVTQTETQALHAELSKLSFSELVKQYQKLIIITLQHMSSKEIQELDNSIQKNSNWKFYEDIIEKKFPQSSEPQALRSALATGILLEGTIKLAADAKKATAAKTVTNEIQSSTPKQNKGQNTEKNL